MSVRRGRGGAATGHSSAAFEFTNNGERCALDGYPMLLGLNDADQWEPVAALQSRNSFIPPPPPLNGPLERGEIAVVLLQMTDRGNYPNRECPTAPKIPPTYRALRFVLPADTTPLDIVGMFGNGCSLTVSPFGKPN
jgi:hypothetical protein